MNEEQKEKGYIGQMIRQESDMFDILPIDKQDSMEWLSGPGYIPNGLFLDNITDNESLRPVEDIVQERLDGYLSPSVVKNNYLKNNMKGIKMYRRRDNGTALAFDIKQVRALKGQGFVVDIVQLRKEVKV